MFMAIETNILFSYEDFSLVQCAEWLYLAPLHCGDGVAIPPPLEVACLDPAISLGLVLQNLGQAVTAAAVLVTVTPTWTLNISTLGCRLCC